MRFQSPAALTASSPHRPAAVTASPGEHFALPKGCKGSWWADVVEYSKVPIREGASQITFVSNQKLPPKKNVKTTQESLVDPE